jgi:hypothetical protein
VSKPGVYIVTIRAFDTSTNGVGGGPVHTPSDPIDIYFEGGVNVASVELGENSTAVHYAAPVGAMWQLESSSSLDPNAEWTPVEQPVIGDDYFHAVVYRERAPGNRFYRIKRVLP